MKGRIIVKFPVINEPLSNLPHTHKFNAVDIFKFICVILICTIHIGMFNKPEFKDFNFAYKNTICRIAVPFFFVAAGFFLFRKEDTSNINNKRVKDYCILVL